MSNFRATPRLSSCLVVTAPTTRLAGFSCVDLGFQGSREFACFRLINDGAIRDYRERYDPGRSQRYKAASARCPGTNGDAAEAANSLFPQSLSSVAKGLFGFSVGLGDARIPTGLAYHGFGSLDPDLALGGSALEVFDMTQIAASQTNQAVADRTDVVGDWNFDINDMHRDARRDFASRFEHVSGERIGVNLRSITFTTSHSSEASIGDRESRLEHLQGAIEDYLGDNGYRSLTRQEMASTPFSNTDQMRDFMVKNMPYGNRDFIRRTFGPHLVFLVNDADDHCYKVAEALTAEPEEGVKNDFGGMAVIVITIGTCRDDGGASKVLNQTIDEETELLEKKVSRP